MATTAESSKYADRGSDMSCTPEDDIIALLSKIIDGSVGTSEAELLKIAESLPSDKNTTKLLAACFLAAMNIKSSVMKMTEATKIIVPKNMKTGDTVNMTVMAMLGHIMMAASESDFTKVGLAYKKTYMKSIGDVKDIRTFTVFREATSKRTTILRKYSEILSNYDIDAFVKVLRPKFPALYKVAWYYYEFPSFRGIFSFFWRIGIWILWKFFLLTVITLVPTVSLNSVGPAKPFARSLMKAFNPDLVLASSLGVADLVSFSTRNAVSMALFVPVKGATALYTLALSENRFDEMPSILYDYTMTGAANRYGSALAEFSEDDFLNMEEAKTSTSGFFKKASDKTVMYFGAAKAKTAEMAERFEEFQSGVTKKEESEESGEKIVMERDEKASGSLEDEADDFPKVEKSSDYESVKDSKADEEKSVQIKKEEEIIPIVEKTTEDPADLANEVTSSSDDAEEDPTIIEEETAIRSEAGSEDTVKVEIEGESSLDATEMAPEEKGMEVVTATDGTSQAEKDEASSVRGMLAAGMDSAVKRVKKMI